MAPLPRCRQVAFCLAALHAGGCAHNVCARHHAHGPCTACAHARSTQPPRALSSPPRGPSTRSQLTRNAARSAFTGAVVWLDYMLMLVAMTFNIGLIVSATLGFMLGALAFGGRMRAGKGGGGGRAPHRAGPQRAAEAQQSTPLRMRAAQLATVAWQEGRPTVARQAPQARLPMLTLPFTRACRALGGTRRRGLGSKRACAASQQPAADRRERPRGKLRGSAAACARGPAPAAPAAGGHAQRAAPAVTAARPGRCCVPAMHQVPPAAQSGPNSNPDVLSCPARLDNQWRVHAPGSRPFQAAYSPPFSPSPHFHLMPLALSTLAITERKTTQ